MHGPVGTHVEIYGGFAPGTAVYMTSEPLPMRIHSRRHITVVIPPNAQTGMLLVTNGDEEESCGTFTVTPSR
jgi:hypothetical protein